MKNTLTSRTVLLLSMLAVASLSLDSLFASENPAAFLKEARGLYRTDRQVVVAESLQLTESERTAFWPLYREYRAAMENLGDSLVKLVLEYADLYPNVPEDRARQLFKDYIDLEKKLVSDRAGYLKKFARILPPAKALRFAQVENRLDLALRLQLASAIPLSPIEGRLSVEASDVAVSAEGVPGGAVVQTYELTARVVAMDRAARKVTLLGADSIKQTVKVGPEAVNFDQIRVGDQLAITVAEELVVYVAGENETPTDGAVSLVALAPKGAKPGGVVVETTQVTAKVTALDAARRKATLEFEDGTSRTVAVRPDVDLSKRKVGDKVVIRTTESLAIAVKKP